MFSTVELLHLSMTANEEICLFVLTVSQMEKSSTQNEKKTSKTLCIFNFAISAISQVIKRMFRPWLQLEWFRKITNYQKKLIFFQKFSDEIMDGVNILFFYFFFRRVSPLINPFQFFLNIRGNYVSLTPLPPWLVHTRSSSDLWRMGQAEIRFSIS